MGLPPLWLLLVSSAPSRPPSKTHPLQITPAKTPHPTPRTILAKKTTAFRGATRKARAFFKKEFPTVFTFWIRRDSGYRFLIDTPREPSRENQRNGSLSKILGDSPQNPKAHRKNFLRKNRPALHTQSESKGGKTATSATRTQETLSPIQPKSRHPISLKEQTSAQHPPSAPPVDPL